jgi:acyl-CoA synthetase (AMP-forming)/AMP-acid ligase II/acyl carrier protein
LRELGIQRNDRVALVLPNGPAMAAAVLGVAACATCAPLNPAYQASEYAFYLRDLRARALLLEPAGPAAARSAAEALSIPIFELLPAAEPSGRYCVRGAPLDVACSEGLAEADDVALALHTSGTTARPKLVPLTQRNICTSAQQIAGTLRLRPADRALSIMPLFHIHGLIGVLLASLTAGASTICAPGFEAPRFFEWLDSCAPSWYSAVPTMHQAILARAAGQQPLIARRPLRFLRSASAPLPVPVLLQLEQLFGAPVIEAYGMTEASHQIASNPLPPGQRKPGSVGRPAGCEVAIMDQLGGLLPDSTPGEIVIRGPNVTPGYADDPAANQRSFTAGWLRTGDQGKLDAQGYLFISGRLKEQINRSGEKISPREVDEVLLSHPQVAQAVTFAMPHPLLGEEVAAAVVLRGRGALSERELQSFAAGKLAAFKIPRRVAFVEAIPIGATGKIQRSGLAERLGLYPHDLAPGTDQARATAPQSALECELADIWREVLQVDQLGADDPFLALGGDSVMAAQIVAQVAERLRVELPLILFFDGLTIRALASAVESLQAV